MMHQRRVWGVSPCADPDELARKLTDHSWTLCTAFETAVGTVWANDSTREGALQEYGILRRLSPGGAQDWRQVETITVSWCTAEKLRGYIDQADAGAFDQGNFGTIADRQIELEHAPCPRCM